MHILAQYYAILAILCHLAAVAAFRCVVPPIGPPPPQGVRSPAYFLCSHVFVHLVDTFIYVVAELALIKCEKIIAARDPKTGQWWLVLSLDRATSPLSKKTSQDGQKLGRWQPYIEKKIASIVFLKKKRTIFLVQTSCSRWRLPWLLLAIFRRHFALRTWQPCSQFKCL